MMPAAVGCSPFRVPAMSLPMSVAESQLAAPSRRRWFRPTPGRLVLLVLLAVEGLLWLSERFQWFAFNQHAGWTVLIALAGVGVFLLLMLFWYVLALVFRWRFQFSILWLLVLTLAVALPCSWLAAEIKRRGGRRRPRGCWRAAE